MFLAKPGVYEPCGLFTVNHLILFLVTTACIFVAVKLTKVDKKEDVKKIIKSLTITIWILEIIKTIFVIYSGDGKDINKMVPLYYCSLLLYSGLLSSFGKGVAKRMGDVFLATGGIIAGFVFIILPTTSLPDYPAWHFISVHSFFFHGTMVYLGVIMNKFKYIDLKISDIKYYAFLIFVICVGAYIVNSKYGSNLMFISQDFPGTPVTIAYHYLGKGFTVAMCLSQMTLPFLAMFGIIKIKEKFGIKLKA